MSWFSTKFRIFNLIPLKFSLLVSIIAFFSINCSNEQSTHEPNNPDETTFIMPRPTDWIFGTWLGTIPTGSVFAEKKIRLVIEEVSAQVKGSAFGYDYKGNFTWDYQSNEEWIVNFSNPMSITDSYLWWLYDKVWDVETFRCEIFYNSNHVVLGTTQIGLKNTKPTVINLYLSATINGISEQDKFMVTMSKL